MKVMAKRKTLAVPPPVPKLPRSEAPWWDLGNPWQVTYGQKRR